LPSKFHCRSGKLPQIIASFPNCQIYQIFQGKEIPHVEIQSNCQNTNLANKINKKDFYQIYCSNIAHLALNNYEKKFRTFEKLLKVDLNKNVRLNNFLMVMLKFRENKY